MYSDKQPEFNCYQVREMKVDLLRLHCLYVGRHVAVSPQTCETTDKFRIHMFEEGSAEVRCDNSDLSD